MIRYCLSDIAKGLFNGMIGNYLLYFFQPTVKSGLPNLLPQNKLLGFITVMALITGLGKVIDAITDGLNSGDKIQISGFGTFEIKEKPAREGINPKTQEKISIPATKIPTFKFGKAYKDSFNA